MTATSLDPTTTAQQSRATPGASVFNAVLADMHGRTSCLGSTMSQLTPFPAIPALADAAVLDVHIALTRRADGRVTVHAKTRYETAASTHEAATFYRAQFNAASDSVTAVFGGPKGANAHFEAALGTGRYSARLFDLGLRTTVMVESDSTQQLDDVPFEDLADWHGFDRFDGATIVQAEVFTVSAGRCAPPQTVYSTEYRFAGMTVSELRSMTDDLLLRQGLSATEIFEDSLMFDGAFTGEAHVAPADGGAHLTIVGEFPMIDELPQHF